MDTTKEETTYRTAPECCATHPSGRVCWLNDGHDGDHEDAAGMHWAQAPIPEAAAAARDTCTRCGLPRIAHADTAIDHAYTTAQPATLAGEDRE
jgi:hypothetical protein